MILKALALAILGLGSASFVTAEPQVQDDPLIDQVAGGVCRVEVMRDPNSEETTTSSGFLVDESGLVITNWHVVSGGVSGSLQFKGDRRNMRYPFDVVAFDQGNDLALLQVKSVVQLLRLRLWVFALRDEILPAGQPGYALGYPKKGFTSHQGPVNALRTYGEIAPIGDRYPPESTWLQHNCPIDPDITGGPLIDDDGLVAGIVTWSTSEGRVKFASPTSKIHSMLLAAQDHPAIPWSEIAIPSKAILTGEKTWDIPEARVSRASGASVLSAIRALHSAGHCPICGGDGAVMKQSTTESKNPLSPGEISKQIATCKRCKGSGYAQESTKVARVLDSLTLKIAGLTEDDRRFEQASEQFFDKISTVAWYSPVAWRTLVNADYPNRLRRLKPGKPIFGMGLIGESITLNGLGAVSVVRPIVDAGVADSYVFVMIDPRLDNRSNDMLQAAFWGGVVADIQRLEDNTTVLFIRNGFVMEQNQTPAD